MYHFRYVLKMNIIQILIFIQEKLKITISMNSINTPPTDYVNKHMPHFPCLTYRRQCKNKRKKLRRNLRITKKPVVFSLKFHFVYSKLHWDGWKKWILPEISHVKSQNGFGTHFSFIWQFGFEQGPNKAYKSQKKQDIY